ncbi:unnamed protein product [marine sediment metagenome]|uniref:Uncharacterized protein n=1 Tax=marine sediment metagenome TaxID=412755 RepID=X0S3C5_9ZZZZ
MKIFENKELFGAIGLTVVSYFSVLLASSMETTYIITALIILMCTVYQWLKVTKNYVNRAIEQKLEESKNKESD